MVYGGRIDSPQPRNYKLAMDAAAVRSNGAANIDATPGAITLSDQVFVKFELSAK